MTAKPSLVTGRASRGLSCAKQDRPWTSPRGGRPTRLLSKVDEQKDRCPAKFADHEDFSNPLRPGMSARSRPEQSCDLQQHELNKARKAMAAIWFPEHLYTRSAIWDYAASSAY